MGYDMNIYSEQQQCIDFDSFSIGSINGPLLAKVFDCSWFPSSIIQDMQLSEATTLLTDTIFPKLEEFKNDKQYTRVKYYLSYMLDISNKHPDFKWNIS